MKYGKTVEHREFSGHRPRLRATATLVIALLLSLASVIVPSGGVHASGGAFDLDSAFSSAIGSGSSVSAEMFAIQSDGKILLGGSFDSFNGAPAGRLVRLNADGSRDTAFDSAIGSGVSITQGTIYAIEVQESGKILVGGSFVSFNGVEAGGLVRLNPDGSRDTAFDAAVGSAVPISTEGRGSWVASLVSQPDGTILVGGPFESFNGDTAGRLVRLNADGVRDSAFDAADADLRYGSIDVILVQPDGKILVGGTFLGSLARLESDGSPDQTFNASGPSSGPVYALALQADGKILVGGSFLSVDGNLAAKKFVRLDSDGFLDTAFTDALGSGFELGVRSINVTASGEIVLGGAFEEFQGETAGGLLRLTPDGTRDSGFDSDIGTAAELGGNPANAVVRQVHLQADGGILISGSFNLFNGSAVPTLVRLVPVAPPVDNTEPVGTIAATSPVKADGEDASIVSVSLLDADGNMYDGDAVVEITSTLGTISAVEKRTPGIYEAELRSTDAGDATVTATVGGEQVGVSTGVEFVAVKPSSEALSIELEHATRAPGDLQTATGRNFLPGERVSGTLHSIPVDLGTVVADENGAIVLSFIIPTGIEAGHHTVTLSGEQSGSVSQNFEVTARPGIAATGANAALPLVFGLLAVLLGAGVCALVIARRRAAAEEKE